MKTYTADLTLSALAMCRIAQFTLKDESVLRVTDAAEDVIVDGETFLAVPGLSISDIPYSDQATANPVEIKAIVDAAGPFKPAEVGLGKLRSARAVIRRADLVDAVASDWLFTGIVADVTWSPDRTSITIEIRSDTANARAIVVEIYGPICRAIFGDYINPATPGRCKLPVKPDDVEREADYEVGDYVRVATGVADNPLDYANRFYVCTTAGETDAVQPSYDTTVGNFTTDGTAEFVAFEAWLRTVTVTAINSAYSFTVSATGDARATDGHFALGVFAVNGIYHPGYEIRKWTASSRLVETWLPITGLVAVSDIVDLEPGCNRTRARCFEFSNVVNFRGEP